MQLTKQMIEVLRREYGKLNGIDPSSPSYKKLVGLLDKLPRKDLQKLVDAQIKFISPIALNRVMRIDREATGQFKGKDTSALSPLKALMVEDAGVLEVKTAEARLQKARYVVEKAKRHGGQPTKSQLQALNAAKDALAQAINKASQMDTASLTPLKALMVEASEDEANTAPEIAPSGVLLATTVEKARHGDSLTTFELAPVIKRLAFSDLSQEEIAKRFTAAFSDVLFAA
ncbi:hypothetical protein EVC12_136 [Rhizobium phage RHph_I42]|nr:hypothetical protein EVC12_136 [Rhizobium phage RHph_I42]